MDKAEKIRYSAQADELYHIIRGKSRTGEASGQYGSTLNVRDIAEAILLAGYRKLPKDKPPDDDVVDDGFSTSCSAWCPECGKKSMFVCRPGDIRCSNCEGK